MFESISDEFTAFAAKLEAPDLTVVPMSALHGDNVVTRSASMPWYDGPALLHHLEHVHIDTDRNLGRRTVPGAVRHPSTVDKVPGPLRTSTP